MILKFYLVLMTGFLSFSPHSKENIWIDRGKHNTEEDILYYVNLDRKSKGLRPLQLNTIESSIATQHSRNMASGKTPFGHDGLNARAKAIRKQLGSITMVGENVASGPMTPKEAVEGWLQSPGHKRNIEGDFTLTGIGWAKGKKGMIYYTQIFTK